MTRSRRKKQEVEVAQLYVQTSSVKGRCVHTRTRIYKGDRFLKYGGILCYEEPEGDDTYIFEFKWKGKTYWIDSTMEDDSFGRLVNDDQYKPNCKVKVDDSQGTPELFFYALRDIESGEEILYNYGSGPYPWRKKREKSRGSVRRWTEDDSDGPEMLDNQSQPPEGPGAMQVNQSQSPGDPDVLLDDQSQSPEGPYMLDDESQPPDDQGTMLDYHSKQPHGRDVMLRSQLQSPEGPDAMLENQLKSTERQDVMLENQSQSPECQDMMLNDQIQSFKGPDILLDDQSQPSEGPEQVLDKQLQTPECQDAVLFDRSQSPEGQDNMLDNHSQPPEGLDIMPDNHSQSSEVPEITLDDHSQSPEGPDIMLGDQSQLSEDPEELQEKQSQTPEGPDEMLDNQSQSPEGLDMMLDNQSKPPEGQDTMLSDQLQPSDGLEIMLDNQSQSPEGLDMMLNNQSQSPEASDLMPEGPEEVLDKHDQPQSADGPESVIGNQSKPPGGQDVMLDDQTQLKKEAIVGHQTVDTRQVSAEEDNLPTVTDSTIKHKGIVEDEGEVADGHCRRVFVCSGSHKVQEQFKELVSKCGGELVPEFQTNTTHVIMQADEPRCCNRSLKYLLGIAHHCWILDHRYVGECLKAGYYLPEGEYEIVGDRCYPNSFGASLSRQTRKKIFSGLKIRITGDSESFSKDDAEDIVLSLGGEVDIASSCIISINDEGEPNTVSRDWLFDCLSSFTPLKMDLYNCEMLSSFDNIDRRSSLEKGKIRPKRLWELEDEDWSSEAKKLRRSSVVQTVKPLKEAEVQRVSKLDSESQSSNLSISTISTLKTVGKDEHHRITFDEQMDTDDFVEDSDDDDYDDDDDDNYTPSEESDSDSESIVYPVQDTVTKFVKESFNCTQACRDQEQNEMAKSSIPEVNVQQETIQVAASKKTEDGKRIWDKKHVCIYCMNHYAKLARHLEQVHAKELDVQRALSYDKNSAERKQVWREIMNKGDFAHNAKVLEHQKGEIIPFKRPSKVTDGMKYVQCESCLGTFLGSDLWRHVKKCHPDKKEKATKMKRYHQISSAALLPFSSEAANNFLEIILNRMTNDSISLIARNDCDIVGFGQKMFMKYAKNPHQHQYIRQKMRELARFLSYVRAADNTIERLRDCIDSTKFSVCVKAVRGLCGYNEGDFTFKVPSLAKKLGHSLHRVARQLKVKAAKTGDEDLKKKAKSFIEVYLEDWESEISHAALETLEVKKYNKASRIPLAEDLKALTTHLKDKAEVLSKILATSDASEVEWRQLCEITLAQVVLFNKRRSGEAERLEVKQYLEGIQQGKSNQEEFLLSLSPLEKQLSEVIDRVELRGKRGRRVAILLPDNLRKQLDILVKTRAVGHINACNKYMFARAGEAEFPVRASDVLRKYANECGAKHPELLNSTSFRKHIAVIVQMLNLKENELDVLAGFLGHDIRVHREFYRLPQDTLQIAKVSKLLMELEKGNIHLYKGKNLDEIQFDLGETLDEEQEEVEEYSDVDEAATAEAEPSNSVTQVTKISSGKKPKAACNRRKWTTEEEAAVKRQLNKYFFLNQLPGKCEIEESRKHEPVLMKRSWEQIKSFIKNKKISMKRKQSAQVP